MKKQKKKSIFLVILDMIISLILGFFVWSLGIITFIGYLFAFAGAIYRDLFRKKKNMAWKLFIGTLLIYLAGILFWQFMGKINSGDWITGILMFALAAYLWLRGRVSRKHGKSVF